MRPSQSQLMQGNRIALPDFVSTAGTSRLGKVLKNNSRVADELHERKGDVDVDADVGSMRRVGVAGRREAEESVVGRDPVSVEKFRQVPVQRRREQPVYSDRHILDFQNYQI